MVGLRVAVATASARTLPACTNSAPTLIGVKYICVSPRMTLVTASGAPLYGT